jgi:hypothetical protein
VDEGAAEQQRLDALAPADTTRLDNAEAAIDEAKQAADPVLKHQDPDPPAEPEAPENAPDGQPTPAESPG